MPSEYSEVEKPGIEILKSLGYVHLTPEENATEREALNHVIPRDTFLTSVQRINGIDEETAPDPSARQRVPQEPGFPDCTCPYFLVDSTN